jgi:hypothetical protein
MRARLLEQSKVPHEELRCEASSDEEDVVDIGKRTSLSFLLLTPSTQNKPWLALRMCCIKGVWSAVELM